MVSFTNEKEDNFVHWLLTCNVAVPSQLYPAGAGFLGGAGTTQPLQTWGLGFVLLFLFAALPWCPSPPTLPIQPSAVRLGNEIHLPGIPGLEFEPGLFVPSICSACLSFVLSHSSGNAGVAAALQCERPLALQETPARDCWIFNPQS